MMDMSPEGSPSTVGSGGRAVNNRPIMFFALLVTAFAGVMGAVALSRSEQTAREVTLAEEKPRSGMEIARDMIDKIGNTGLIPPSESTLREPPSSPGALRDDSAPNQQREPGLMGAMPLTETDTHEEPKAPSAPEPRSEPETQIVYMNSRYEDSTQDLERDRILQIKREQFQQAVALKATVSFSPGKNDRSLYGGSSGDANAVSSGAGLFGHGGPDATVLDESLSGEERYQARVAEISGAISAETYDGSDIGLEGLSGTATDVAQATAERDRWKLGASVQNPRSAYELRAGFVIPATLISGINSELPGQVVAQVSQHVYDTATGSFLLIPQGTRLVGLYSNAVAFGQSRVMIAWQRLIFPDGKAIDIGEMPGGDQAGYSGFEDQVDNHYFRLFASAILMSGVTAGIAVSQGNASNDDTPSTSQVMSEALANSLGQVVVKLIEKNLNVSPTIRIRPGYRFNVVVTKDVPFDRPYSPFDYSASGAGQAR